MKRIAFKIKHTLIIVGLSIFLMSCEAENTVREALGLPLVNEEPAAVISGDLFTNERAEIVFDANNSSDNDGSISTYEWSLDSTQFVGSAIELQVDGKQATLIVEEVGEDQTVSIHLKVTDDDGDSGTTKVEVTIEEIDRAKLPPASSISRLTLLGDDIDRDGVRDDMETIILDMYPLAKGTREAARQSVIVLNELLAAGETSSNLELELIAERVSKNISCIHNNDTFNYRAYKLLRAIMIDTPERIAAYQAFDSKMTGKVQNTVEAQANECKSEQN